MNVNERFPPFEIFIFTEKLRNGLETGIFPYIMMIHLGLSLRRPKREKFLKKSLTIGCLQPHIAKGKEVLGRLFVTFVLTTLARSYSLFSKLPYRFRANNQA